MTHNKLIVLSAGGTGGHMFPAAALARDLLSRGYRVELVTDRRGKKYAETFGAIPIHVLPAGTLHPGLFGKLRGATSLVSGIVRGGALLRKLKPAVVVGFGGYPSVPGVWAAQRLKIPTILHEQNAILGKANKLLAPRAQGIALSLPHMEGLQGSAAAIVVTGNPVREDIAMLCTKPYPMLDGDGVMRLFVMGGSQGSNVFAHVVPQALAKFPAEVRARLHVTQQCRPEDLDNVRTLYHAAQIEARLENFFTDVPTVLAASHLVISRSGASTVAEITAAGRPAIFVPYPHHADQQQKVNADTVADGGGAWVMLQDSGFTIDALYERLNSFLQNPQTLFRAAEAARACGRPDAARRLGNLVTEIASGWGHRDTHK